MLKVGDKVRVKSIEDLEKLYKTDSYDVTKGMLKYADEEGVIVEVRDEITFRDEKLIGYELDFDKGFWTWYSNLIEKA